MTRSVSAIVAAGIIALFAGCTGPVGPAGTAGTNGTTGTQGIPGPSVYLVDSATSVRYYSGASIDLGWASNSGSAPVSKVLSLVNKTAGTVTFTGLVPAAKVETIDASITYPPSPIVFASGAAADSGFPEIYISSQLPTSTTTVPSGSSVSFTLGFSGDLKWGAAWRPSQKTTKSKCRIPTGRQMILPSRSTACPPADPRGLGPASGRAGRPAAHRGPARPRSGRS